MMALSLGLPFLDFMVGLVNRINYWLELSSLALMRRVADIIQQA